LRECDHENRAFDAGGGAVSDDDPRCPECGGPIGQTATYCMHCSADLTEELQAADDDGDWRWDDAAEKDPARDGAASPGSAADARATGPADDQLLDPDGLVDDSLTVVVGIVGGMVVGVVGTVVLAAVTGSGWALLFGVVVWLGATAYLVRRRTVQAAVARSGHAVALVLLSVPAIALSPAMDVEGGLAERGSLLVVLGMFVVVPAVVAAGVGWVASQYVPGEPGSKEG
jgi:hypothetical protein